MESKVHNGGGGAKTFSPPHLFRRDGLVDSFVFFSLFVISDSSARFRLRETKGRKTSRADQHPAGGDLRTDKTTTSLDKSKVSLLPFHFNLCASRDWPASRRNPLLA